MVHGIEQLKNAHRMQGWISLCMKQTVLYPFFIVGNSQTADVLLYVTEPNHVQYLGLKKKCTMCVGLSFSI